MFGSDVKGMVLYIMLLLKSANQDGQFRDDRGKVVEVKRGQVIFGRNKFAKYISSSPKTVERTLSRLCLNPVLKMTKQTNENFTIVTIENYDEVTSMTQQRPSNDQAMTTSKNVKNVKNVKIIKKENRERVFERLNQSQLWTIAKNNSVAYLDVVSKQEDVFDSLANGNKKIHDIRATVSSWVRYSINHKTMEQLSPEDMQMEAEAHDPGLEAERQRKKLLIEQIDGNNKSSLDFARGSKILP